MDTQKNRLFSVEETASILDLSRLTVYALIKRGEIPHVKLGRSVKVPADYLERMTNSRQSAGAQRRGPKQAPPVPPRQDDAPRLLEQLSAEFAQAIKALETLRAGLAKQVPAQRQESADTLHVPGQTVSRSVASS
jgi:excisionase family DNA binding protein